MFIVHHYVIITTIRSYFNIFRRVNIECRVNCEMQL